MSNKVVKKITESDLINVIDDIVTEAVELKKAEWLAEQKKVWLAENKVANKVLAEKVATLQETVNKLLRG